jgi:hypothetical protein
MRRELDSARDRYSRYQVRSVERCAWAGGAAEGSAPYFYDGLSFWRQRSSGKSRVLASWQTPVHGWRHRPTCTCDLCRARTPSDRRR